MENKNKPFQLKIQKINSVISNFSESEKKFFNIERFFKIRNDENHLHPLILDLNYQIAKQNKENHFIDQLYLKIGVPIWDKSIVYTNLKTRKEIIILPFKDPFKDSISGILTAHNVRENIITANNVQLRNVERNNDFDIKALTRRQVVNNINSNKEEYFQYIGWINYFEKRIFRKQNISIDLKDALCINAPFNFNNMSERNSPIDCEWVLEQICWDVTEVRPGEHPLFDADDDHDGIKNYEDDDWWAANLSPETVQEYIYWYDDDQDGTLNYEDISFDWEEWSNDIDQLLDDLNIELGIWWEHFWGPFQDGWDDFWSFDWWGDLWDEIDCYDDWLVKPDNSNKRPDIINKTQQIENRSEKHCIWYFVLYCDGEWWKRVIYDGPDLIEDRDWLYKKVTDLKNHWRYNCSEWDIMGIAERAGCDLYNPDPIEWEQCVHEAYINYFKHQVEQYVIQDIPNITADQVLSFIDDEGMFSCGCELSGAAFAKCAKTTYLNKKLNLNCDISDHFTDEAQDKIFDLLHRNDFSDECSDPKISNDDIFRNAINGFCGKNPSYPKKSFNDFLTGLASAYLGPQLDWRTATDVEKATQILKALRYANWLLNCDVPENSQYQPGIEVGKIRLEKLFENLPTGGVWAGGGISACVTHDKIKKPLDVKINLLLEYWQNRKCLYSSAFERDNGTYRAYDFTSCEGRQGRIEGMSIKVSSGQASTLIDFINPTDLPCPRK
jgi:hypothetical protein